MSVGVEGVYDFVLQDQETNPTVVLGLVIDEPEGEPQRWREFRVPPIPQRRSSGPLSWTHKDPISDLVFAQNDWQDGALRPYYKDSDPATYAKTDGIDLRAEGVMALHGRRAPIRQNGTIKSRIQSNIYIANGDFEEGQTGIWTAGTGVTETVETDTVRTGIYSGKAVVAQSTSAGSVFSQTFANPTVWRSRSVTVIAYIRRDVGSDSGVFLRLTDSAGTPTDSSAVTSATWTYVSVTRTIDSGATSITLSIEHNATTTNADHTFYVDDVHVISAGSQDERAKCFGFAVRGSTSPDEIYAAVGRTVVLWNETTFVWEAVYVDSDYACTAIIDFDDQIFVAFGETDGITPRQYIYGTSTTWTTAAINSTTTHQDNHARFWVKARNGYGTMALWKAGPSTDQGTERNKVQWATDPTNTGAWNPSTPFSVGTTDRFITGLFPFHDTFIVSKVDGLWAWDETLNTFTNLTPDWDASVDEKNGSVATPWYNDLYLATAQQGFFKLTGDSIQSLSQLLIAPRLTDFGGRVTALVASPRELILALDQPTTDTTITKTSRLVRLGYDGKTFTIHTQQEPEIALIDALSFHRGTRLWAFGRTHDSNLGDYHVSMNVWAEPSKSSAPYQDAVPAIEWQGTMDTSIWHGGSPETNKAFIALTIWCEDLDSEHTVQVDFGRDGRPSSDNRLGTFSSPDQIQTLLFKNINNPTVEAVGRFCQLRFTLTTDDTVSPKIYAFALHTQLAPEPIKSWDVWVRVSNVMKLRTGVSSPDTKAELESKFQELEQQTFPITFIEDLGQSHGGAGGINTRQVRLVDYERTPADSIDQGEDVWRLRLQEVAISG